MEKPIEPNLGNKPVSRGIDAASDSAHHAIDSASAAAAPALEQITAGAHNTVNKLASGANHAVDAVSSGSAKLHELQQHFSERCRCQVREKPLLSLGVAVVSGIILSWWFCRNKTSPDNS